MDKKLRAAVYTLGCRVNQYESDAVSQGLREAGFEIVPFDGEWDVAVINTCTVTMESDHKSRKAVRRAVAKNPDGAVIVTGCFAQVSPDEAAEIPGVSLVCGNAEKEMIPAMAAELCGAAAPARVNVSDIDTAGYDSMVLAGATRQRSYIKIEDGCENKCAYCIIPRARGKVRSKPVEAVLDEVRRIAESGCPEVILTGIETASYGKDFENGYRLPDLLRDVCRIDGIERIALGSLDPTALRGDFLAAVAESGGKVLPHFHLSVQSGCDRTLHRMRRRYNASQVLSLMEEARSAIPGVTFSADVIVGFPGETEEDFLDTAEFCRKARFLHLHIFPYSKRGGTEAAEMADQLTAAEKKQRVGELSLVQREIKERLLRNYVEAHKTEPIYVLAEEMHGDYMFGHSEHFAEVLIGRDFDPEAVAGKILAVRATGLSDDLEVICTLGDKAL